MFTNLDNGTQVLYGATLIKEGCPGFLCLKQMRELREMIYKNQGKLKRDEVNISGAKYDE
jgi:hypothetical protein